jgi:hypothetical protein
MTGMEIRRRDIVRSRPKGSALLIRIISVRVIGVEVGGRGKHVIEEWRNRKIHAHDPTIKLFLIDFLRDFFHPLSFDLLVTILLSKTTWIKVPTPMLKTLSTVTTFLSAITQVDVIILQFLSVYSSTGNSLTILLIFVDHFITSGVLLTR